ncbi:MAG: MerR family transcriptional regulator [Caldilineaceae bacterium]|nr:MerR family transcriptional regulator [Caldilineaceae bacterium]
MINQKERYTVQEVSNEIDLPISTLHYYEESGLLDPIQRASNGHRQYGAADLRRLILIKRLRLAGMTIEQIRDFVVLYKTGKQTARQRREILISHRETVQARIDELLDVLAFIDHKIEAYYAEETESDHQQQG